MRYVGYVACMGKGVVNSFCSGNLCSMTQFGRPRHRRVDNIRYSRNMIEDMDWTDLAHDRVMWEATAKMVNLWV